VLLVVLVLIWVVALAPIAYRRYVDRQANTSVDRFRQRVLKVRRAYPAVVMTDRDLGPQSRVEQRRSIQAEISRARARLQQRRERRRRVLITMVGVIVASAALGAVPALHMLWIVSVIALACAAGYVVLLVQIARNESLELERLRKIVPLGNTPSPVYDERVAAAGGASFRPLFAAPLPQRPAFVVLESPR
jgi:Flp pilus assembly protein TadB